MRRQIYLHLWIKCFKINFKLAGQILKRKMTVCLCVAKIRTLQIKYETLILGFNTQLHLCRLSQLENPNELREDQINVTEP